MNTIKNGITVEDKCFIFGIKQLNSTQCVGPHSNIFNGGQSLGQFYKTFVLNLWNFTMIYDCIRIVWDYFQNSPKTYVSKAKKWHPTN